MTKRQIAEGRCPAMAHAPTQDRIVVSRALFLPLAIGVSMNAVTFSPEGLRTQFHAPVCPEDHIDGAFNQAPAREEDAATVDGCLFFRSDPLLVLAIGSWVFLPPEVP